VRSKGDTPIASGHAGEGVVHPIRNVSIAVPPGGRMPPDEVGVVVAWSR